MNHLAPGRHLFHRLRQKEDSGRELTLRRGSREKERSKKGIIRLMDRYRRFSFKLPAPLLLCPKVGEGLVRWKMRPLKGFPLPCLPFIIDSGPQNRMGHFLFLFS
ncbi:hypothetical protein CDAR_106331 [Caerostris darwini]|uniref:Uncharacterized protein n=1 Tax=Caerostris darwini TaxID=1538125 RepID=A0AAV4SIH5_9ARAC|nr:hypothetical protein CDAR_106331 [Caerostris darwini]